MSAPAVPLSSIESAVASHVTKFAPSRVASHTEKRQQEAQAQPRAETVQQNNGLGRANFSDLPTNPQHLKNQHQNQHQHQHQLQQHNHITSSSITARKSRDLARQAPLMSSRPEISQIYSMVLWHALEGIRQGNLRKR